MDSPLALTVSPVMNFPTECTADGSLFLDELDPKNIKQHTVVSVHGRDTKAFSVSAISDLNDIFVMNVFPSEDTVGFLVRASKEKPGPRVPGKSPAGIASSDYHNFVAEFDRSGEYKGSVQLPIDYVLSHLAILPSGELMVSGYDKLNNTVRLLFLKQSGEILRSIDMPSAAEFASGSGSSGPIEADKAGRHLLGSILFTPYKSDILVWRMNSRDPILDVGPGASVREVPIHPPSGEVFVDMIPATDRWVAHFRAQTAPADAAYSRTADSYYDLNPRDGSISAKLVQSGDMPESLSCESGGRYLSFKTGPDNKLIVLGAE